MKVSYRWLKKYLPDLPTPAEVEQGLIFHSFEVEESVSVGEDTVFEVKVLPDRAHDCLCHFGIAKEIAAIFNNRLEVSETAGGAVSKTARALEVKIEDPKLCRRYVSRVIEGITVSVTSPELKQSLESLEQRSINSIVDVANYVMFDVGQPLHAFDADKVKGNITVRLARAGERLVTLDDKDVALDVETLVIADEEGPIAIAGIKGGKRAEVTMETKNLILESANFDAVNIRRTSGRLGLRTEASKRFENDLSSEVADYAMDSFTKMICDVASPQVVGEKIDVYPHPVKEWQIAVTTNYISERLGINVPAIEVVAILERLGMRVDRVEDELVATPPMERLDLTLADNLVEEVGRIWGYEQVESRLPAKIESSVTSEAMKRFRVINRIRETLVGLGFSEVYGYSFGREGELEVAKPLAEDKAFLRTNLTDNLSEVALSNLNHLLFDHEAVKIFEVGKVFVGGEEKFHCALAVAYRTKKLNHSDADIGDAFKTLEQACDIAGNIKLSRKQNDLSTTVEFDAERFIELAPEKMEFDLSHYLSTKIYKPVSIYPRIIRDVAVWVPESTESTEAQKVIRESVGPLVVAGPVKFDEYKKEERKSLAYRLVLQSDEKTLADEEANEVMRGVIAALEGRGWEVRK